MEKLEAWWGWGQVNTLSNTRAFSAKYSMERIKSMSVKCSEIGSVKAIHETSMAHAWDLSF